MVPSAEFDSYYGRPVLKKPVWKSPDVPGYLFTGGLAGCSAVMAVLADLTRRRQLARVGRVAAGAGATVSVGALVHDLGRPERFLNMLRVFKPTSPLSVGSWILAPFGTLAGAAAASEVTGWLPRAGRVAGAGAAVLGPPLTTYTAALLADTAVPAWHEAYPELPFVFAGSGMQAAGGVGLVGTPTSQTTPARRMAVLGSALELAASQRIEHRLGLVGEPYRTGRAGRLLKLGRVVTGASVALGVLGRRSRLASAVAGVGLMTSSAFTRFAIFDAGMTSAEDPMYTVVPQRERLDGHTDGHTDGHRARR